jgi:integrase
MAMAVARPDPINLWASFEHWRLTQSDDFAGVVRRWLDLSADPSSAGLGDYMRRLEDRGLKASTIDQAYNTIRRFVAFVGLPRPKVSWWHYDPRAADAADRPFFGEDVMAALAEVARATPSVKEAARFCLASIYGLRVSEIARVRQEDVDLAHERIFIHSAKRSRARWCWIPPEVRPWLDVRWEPARVERVAGTLDALWGMAIDKPRPKRAAWHAVRRSVCMVLRERGVEQASIERFIRWKGRSMVDLYTSANVRVGLEGAERIPEQDEGLRQADAAVWDRHPYVGLWA